MTSTSDCPSASLYDEPFRPQFHYSAPFGWLNDPNGLIYYEGEYHLFYQYHPHSTVWGPMHWGHAVSPDLIHWETLPIALYPDSIGTMFSGSAVLDAQNTSGLVPGGGLVAVFSYSSQAQGVAYSTDRGRTWTKYGGNPIIPALRPDFRDPKVFWHNGQWIMVLAAGQSVMFLASPDLLHWEIASDYGAGYAGDVWEVPDLFPLTAEGVTKWVLTISASTTAPAGGSGMRYAIGDFDGQAFTDDHPDEILWLDWGADNYAGTTYNNVADNRRIFMAWMSNSSYAERTPTSMWRGAMTIPRELRLVKTARGYRLAQRPVDALEALRAPLSVWENVAVDGTLALDAITGDTLDIEMEVELENASVFGIDLSGASDDSVRIAYDVHARRLTITRPDTGFPNYRSVFSGPLEAVDHRIRLRLLVDRSSVEVFADDGVLAMTSQMFLAGHGVQVRLFTQHGTATVPSLHAYRLRSIWGGHQ